jgi:hypothetical protein
MSQALSRYFDLIDQDQWESEEAVALRTSEVNPE